MVAKTNKAAARGEIFMADNQNAETAREFQRSSSKWQRLDDPRANSPTELKEPIFSAAPPAAETHASEFALIVEFDCLITVSQCVESWLGIVDANIATKFFGLIVQCFPKMEDASSQTAAQVVQMFSAKQGENNRENAEQFHSIQ